MVNCKDGYIKVNCDIPVEWRDKIKEYNKTAGLQINMSHTMREAIRKVVESIEVRL